MDKLIPTQVNDRTDGAKIGDAETRMRIKDMAYNTLFDGTEYYVRRNPGEMLWSVYTYAGNAPIGYLAATYSDTRAMKLQLWDGTGQPFAYSPYGNGEVPVRLGQGLARLHSYLEMTGRR